MVFSWCLSVTVVARQSNRVSLLQELALLAGSSSVCCAKLKQHAELPGR
jgi:hypothetical protein